MEAHQDPKSQGKKRPQQSKQRPGPPSLAEFMLEAEHLREIAKAMLVADSHHANVLFTWRRDGVREVVLLDLKGFSGSVGDLVRAVVKVRDVVCFIAISEAWVLVGPDAEEALAQSVRPSQHADRREVLAVSACHPEGKRMWYVPFSREGGRIVLGREVDSASAGLTVAGAIPSALDKEGGRP